MLPRVLVVLGCALAGPLVFVGCSSGAVNPPLPQGTPTVIRAYEPDAADAGVTQDTAVPPQSAAAPTFLGSPLCQASRGTGCYPDDMINACDFAPDSSAPDADTDANVNIAPACHVVVDSTGKIQTACEPSTVAGMYASSCAQSTECSPGYECVAGGTCRHYCCSGNSACSDNQFCDVQPVAQSGTLVPVCMTELPCVLLAEGNGGCPLAEQCSVVRDNGMTSCVAVGTAQDGDKCEAEHCARGLLCLGALGSRHCEPLCNTANPVVCTSTSRTCVGMLPLFQDPTVGVCQ